MDDPADSPHGGDDAQAPDCGPARRIHFPSSIGLTALVDTGVERLDAALSWGDYWPEAAEEGEDAAAFAFQVKLSVAADAPFVARGDAHGLCDEDWIVALSEAHDSGLCVADGAARRRFSNDPLDLILVAPEVNRCGRGDKCLRDAAEWIPAMNRRRFAARVVAVRRKYGLTVDRPQGGCAGAHAVGLFVHGDDIR